MAEKSLKGETAKGLLWGSINNGGQQLLNLIFGIFLARLLTAEDYGMVGMLTIFALIASALQESGFISALNRKKDITHADYNAVFWFNVICAVALYVILFFCAPLIAAWFQQPALIPLARLSFLSIILAALGTAPRAYLFRNLLVKKTAGMTLTALLLSGFTGITLAALGMAYWGLAIQNLVYCGVMTICSWTLSGWRPTLHIDLRPLRGMIGFSSRLLITNIFTGINNNIFSIFFGRFYGERQVGLYNQANKWTFQGYTFLNGTLWNVTQPVFARIDDIERQRRAFRKMFRFTAFASCPLLFGLALVAPEFITLLITDKWIESAHLMQILSIGGAFIPVASFYSNYLISQGRSNVFMWCTIGLCVLQTLSAILLHPFGVTVMVVVYVVLGILWLPVWHYFIWKTNGVTLWQALADLLPFVVCAALAMLGAWAVSQGLTSTFWRLVVKVATAFVLYVGMMKALRVVIFEESIAFLLSKFKRKKQS